METFSQDTYLKIRAKDVNHAKMLFGTCGLYALNRTNARKCSFPAEDRSDKGVHHARKWLFGASGMTLPLYKRDRGVPEKAGDAADLKGCGR